MTRRMKAIALAALLVLAVISGVIHVHTGANCPVCAMLAVIRLALTAAFVCVPFALYRRRAVRPDREPVLLRTPQRLKVRLND